MRYKNKDMIMKLREQKENFIYLALWLILYVTPVVNLYFRASSDSSIVFMWKEILDVWKVYTIFLIAFLIHNFLIAPLLIYKDKRGLYLMFTGCLLCAFIVFQCTNHKIDRRLPMPGDMDRGMAGKPRPPMDKGGTAPFDMAKQKPNGHILRGPNGKPGDMRGHRDMHNEPPLIFGQIDVINSIVMFLLLGMNLGVKLYFKSSKVRKEMEDLEKHSLALQLEYLKYQINPHFFMNTLNNIHALVDIDPEKAKSSIVELSKMMRYVLYEGNKNLIPLEREIPFLQNYITLMRMRYTDKVKISVDIPKKVPDKNIPPLMLISFVENAFKHGVSYMKESFINVKVAIDNDRLVFTCINSKAPVATGVHGGVGLENVKKRLKLIYKDDYSMHINDNDDTYEVTLDIPLS
jgi:hypothetical protein